MVSRGNCAMPISTQDTKMTLTDQWLTGELCTWTTQRAILLSCMLYVCWLLQTAASPLPVVANCSITFASSCVPALPFLPLAYELSNIIVAHVSLVMDMPDDSTIICCSACHQLMAHIRYEMQHSIKACVQ